MATPAVPAAPTATTNGSNGTPHRTRNRNKRGRGGGGTADTNQQDGNGQGLEGHANGNGAGRGRGRGRGGNRGAARGGRQPQNVTNGQEGKQSLKAGAIIRISEREGADPVLFRVCVVIRFDSSFRRSFSSSSSTSS